jgi:hypothetical protein
MSLSDKMADAVRAGLLAGLEEAGFVERRSQRFPESFKPPKAFFVWARAQVKACEKSGWGADQYVDAGFTLRQLRQYLANVGEEL